jgi:hypothetical protein
VPRTVTAMAHDALALLDALGLTQVGMGCADRAA